MTQGFRFGSHHLPTAMSSTQAMILLASMNEAQLAERKRVAALKMVAAMNKKNKKTAAKVAADVAALNKVRHLTLRRSPVHMLRCTLTRARRDVRVTCPHTSLTSAHTHSNVLTTLHDVAQA